MARKQKTTRRHEVRATLTNVELVKAKSSLKLEVFANRRKLGELQLGRGAIYWWGAGKQLSKRIDWTRFATMMDELAYGAD